MLSECDFTQFNKFNGEILQAVEDFYKKVFETTHEEVLEAEGDDGSLFHDLDLVLERTEEEEEALRWEAERIRKSLKSRTRPLSHLDSHC